MCEKDVLERLYEVVLERKRNPQEGSYTCYLFDKGLDKILKKVGEESAETIIAAKNGVAPETVGEISDLIYHLMVLLAAQEIPLSAVMEELDRQIDAALPRKLTLDLSGLTFTDSSGIAVILRTYRRMSQLRGGMTVVHAPDQARRVFRAAGLEKLVRFE